MIIDCKSGLRGVLVNGDTGARIPFAIRANLDTGDYEAWQATPDGRAIANPPTKVSGHCARLRFVEDRVKTAVAGLVRQPQTPAVPEEIQRRLQLTDPRLLCPGENAECEEPGCHRRADWLTGDEQLLEPAIDAQGRAWQRGVVIRGHAYCNQHFRNPTSTSLRGVESEVPVNARPQW